MSNDTPILGETKIEIPETTVLASKDTGWLAACLYIMEVANQIFSGTAGIFAVPDPDGFYQEQAGKKTKKPGIFVEISSMAVEGIVATLVVPFELEALPEVRYVFCSLVGQIRDAEEQHDSKQKLLVPEKKLIVPGRDL